MYKVKIQRKVYAVESLLEASRLYETLRDKSGLGGSRFREGAVFDGETEIARISYNGRVWPAGEWFPGQTPLLDNRV